MKNKFAVLVVLGLFLMVVLGCNFSNPLSSDSLSESSGEAPSTSADKPTEAAPSGEIIEVGIRECDELATYINDNSEQIKDEGIVVRGIIEYVKQTIFSNLRDSVKNMSEEDKKKTGENCAKALDNLKKQMQN